MTDDILGSQTVCPSCGQLNVPLIVTGGVVDEVVRKGHSALMWSVVVRHARLHGRSFSAGMPGAAWKSDDLYRASGIRLLTNEESSKCGRIEGETKEQKTERETAEQKFLDGYEPISDEELAKLLAEDEEEEKQKEKKP